MTHPPRLRKVKNKIKKRTKELNNIGVYSLIFEAQEKTTSMSNKSVYMILLVESPKGVAPW